jgi:recombinational DNA repair protein RecT
VVEHLLSKTQYKKVSERNRGKKRRWGAMTLKTLYNSKLSKDYDYMTIC